MMLKQKQSSSRQAIGGDFELGSMPLGSSDKLFAQTYGLSGTWTASGRVKQMSHRQISDRMTLSPM